MALHMKRVAIFIGILFLLNLYVFQGYKILIQNFEGKMALLAKIGYWVLVLMAYLALGYTMTRMGTNPQTFWTKVALSYFFIILVVQLVWSLFMTIDDIVRLFQWIGSFFTKASTVENGISRKSFLMKSGAFVATGFGAALAYGVVRGSHQYQVINQKLTIPNLPEGLKGLKLLQISDIHSGSFWNKNAVQKGVDLIKEQNADLIFFTGDLVNNEAHEMDDYLDVFSQITAPMGVFSTLGNHDYGEYVPGFKPSDLPTNVANIEAVHKKLGWRLLMNEHTILEKNDAKLAVVGIENWGAKMHFKKYGDLNKAISGVDQALPTLLLSHDPSHWRAEVIQKFPQVDATFSGHTHGMQFGIETGGMKWSPVKYLYPEWAGLYKEGTQQLYVNRGFGYLGFPGRLGIWPEITVFELA
ncbi:MAG: putative MPP superfamily phosphohydrolase [Bacteroidia bacterium]|jgi:predicted MPP superfamily phosphohydrolase